MKAISLRLESDQYQRLRWLSFVESRPMSLIIREAVDAYLKENVQPKPGQEWFWTDAWQAAEREVETELEAGEYETYDTMADFLKSLE
jgi:predicted transcriptional regulator